MHVIGVFAMRVTEAAWPRFSPASARRPAAHGALFRLPEAPGAKAASAPVAIATPPMLDHLRRAEQKRRSIRHGRGLLDALDQVKLGLLNGSPAAALQALAERAGQGGDASGDPALDDIVEHIRLRAEVEIAKARVRANRAG